MEDFKSFYTLYLRYFLSKDSETATVYDKYMALSYAVRTHIADQWIETSHRYRNSKIRRVYYIALDYSFGRSLKRYIVDAGIEDLVDQMASTIGATMEELFACEAEMELGNSPKGGMSHCIHETLASQGLPAMGYGIWFDFAGFKQKIEKGVQKEVPYNWAIEQHPWNVNRPEYEEKIGFGGTIKPAENGSEYGEWVPDQEVVATPWDYPVVGYKNGVVNTVRFWEAIPTGSFYADYNNHGDYIRACDEKYNTTNMTRYLFPYDDVRQTTDVRIKQQYFLVSASLRDIIRRYLRTHDNLKNIGKDIVIHLSDSKCAIGAIEMIYQLMTREKISLREALEIVKDLFIFSSAAMDYDNVELWPLYLLEQVLPLHANIVNDLNQLFLDSARKTLGLPDEEARSLSLIEEGAVKKVRLGNIGVLVSKFVSGVSAFQTKLLKEKVFKGFDQYNNTKFLSGVYGISIRRWLTIPNPELTSVITQSIGDNWIANNRDLLQLINKADNTRLHASLIVVKKRAKARIAEYIKGLYGRIVNTESMFIMHSRRIHLSHRQVLQLFYIVDRYLRIKAGEDLCPRTYFFGGRAAPTDFLGKQVIHLINMVATVINSDKEVSEKLQVFFVPNCDASMEEFLLPGIDVVEQPSAKGEVAYGVNVLKFIVNGALPLLGQNEADLEVQDIIGRSYSFTFEEEMYPGGYNPDEIVEESDVLKNVFAYIENFIPGFDGGEAVYPLLSSLRYKDEFRSIGAFESYKQLQVEIDALFPDGSAWMERVIHNIGRVGASSLDDVISDFYNKAWSS